MAATQESIPGDGRSYNPIRKSLAERKIALSTCHLDENTFEKKRYRPSFHASGATIDELGHLVLETASRSCNLARNLNPFPGLILKSYAATIPGLT